MKNKETGEFELVVGNGVLLSGFFIVVLLFAVAFAMGFIVARAKYQQDPQTVAASASAPVTQTAASSRPATETPAPPVTAALDNPPATAAANPQPTSPAATDASAAAAAVPANDTSATQKTGDAASIPEAPPGMYWQVTSTADVQAARVFLQTIKDMGLPVTLSPGPNRFTRVLVGPYADTAPMGKVKSQLEAAGMQPVRHKQ